MIFTETELPGVVVVELEKLRDDRGFFARSFCAEEFAGHGLVSHFPQANISYNREKSTLRGLHYQIEPKPEPKLVRCTRGAIFDVVVDLRADSPGYCRWIARELTADNHVGLYIPPGCAHGFLTLEAGCEVSYLMGEVYHADLAGGVRWNDPAFAIDWPCAPEIISPRDAGYRDFAP